MRQDIQIVSSGALDRNERRIRNMRIANMEDLEMRLYSSERARIKVRPRKDEAMPRGVVGRIGCEAESTGPEKRS